MFLGIGQSLRSLHITELKEEINFIYCLSILVINDFYMSRNTLWIGLKLECIKNFHLKIIFFIRTHPASECTENHLHGNNWQKKFLFMSSSTSIRFFWYFSQFSSCLCLIDFPSSISSLFDWDFFDSLTFWVISLTSISLFSRSSCCRAWAYLQTLSYSYTWFLIPISSRTCFLVYL